MTAPLRVAIGVLTFRRPADLQAVLPALAAQAVSVDGSRYTVDLIVVDNDPDASGRQVVEDHAAASDVPVTYVHEAVPNISGARNRVLDASADADVLVYIDDDERPTERWLEQLLETFEREQATAVVGPVISTYEVEPTPFIVAGGFFTRRRLPTGTRIDVAATNNLLLDRQAIERLGLRFDRSFGTTGGEDQLFTRQLRARGGVMVWCDEAVVVDIVPASRVTSRWVLQRAFSSGNSWGLTSVRLAGSRLDRLSVRLRVTAQGIARVSGGALRYGAGTATRRLDLRAKGMRTVLRGAGMVSGIWGVRYHEYRAASPQETDRRMRIASR